MVLPGAHTWEMRESRTLDDDSHAKAEGRAAVRAWRACISYRHAGHGRILHSRAPGVGSHLAATATWLAGRADGLARRGLAGQTRARYAH